MQSLSNVHTYYVNGPANYPSTQCELFYGHQQRQNACPRMYVGLQKEFKQLNYF